MSGSLILPLTKVRSREILDVMHAPMSRWHIGGFDMRDLLIPPYSS
jgi:hypothetical protein